MTQIRIKEKAWIAQIAARLIHSTNCAIVFRNTIYLHQITKQTILKDKRLLCHELTHVQQWHRYGLIRFPILYLWYSLQFGYEKNPFEKEARSNENNEEMLKKYRVL